MDNEVQVIIEGPNHLLINLSVSTNTTVGYISGYVWTEFLHKGVIDPELNYYMVYGNVLFHSDIRLFHITDEKLMRFAFIDEREAEKIEFSITLANLDTPDVFGYWR